MYTRISGACSIHILCDLVYSPHIQYIYTCNVHAKQKQPGCKKVRGQSEATMIIGDQKL